MVTFTPEAARKIVIPRAESAVLLLTGTLGYGRLIGPFDPMRASFPVETLLLFANHDTGFDRISMVRYDANLDRIESCTCWASRWASQHAGVTVIDYSIPPTPHAPLFSHIKYTMDTTTQQHTGRSRYRPFWPFVSVILHTQPLPCRYNRRLK